MEEIKEYNYCLRCGRKLKSKEARLRGYGKTCYAKCKLSIKVKPLVVIGENMDTLSDEKKQIYLDRLNKVRLMVDANDTQFRIGTITKKEYMEAGNYIVGIVDSIENDLREEGLNV